MCVFLVAAENVRRAAAGDPGSRRGLPLLLLLEPTASPPTSQRVSRRHETPGSEHGEAAPGAPPLPRPELPEAVRAGPLLQPQDGDGRDLGRRTPELGSDRFHLHLHRSGRQTAAGAEEHGRGAGPRAGCGTGARKVQTGGDHRGLPGGGEEGLAAGEQWMGTYHHVCSDLIDSRR